MKTILFNAAFLLVLALLAAQGALSCFWPKKWKSLQERLPRGYNPDSLGGRMLERYRTRDATLGERHFRGGPAGICDYGRRVARASVVHRLIRENPR